MVPTFQEFETRGISPTPDKSPARSEETREVIKIDKR